jgi:hypothetical protein
VSWAAVIALCGAAYTLKLAGAIAAGRASEDEPTSGRLDILVVPVNAGLIAVQTIGTGKDIALDARLPALLIAAVLVWRRAPVLVVVVAAGATAALLRHAA